MMRSRMTREAWTNRGTWERKTPPTTQKPTSFYKEVKLILVLLRVLGKFPYYMTDEGILPFSFLSVITIYSVLLYVIFFYFSTKTLVLLYDTFAASRSYYEKLEVLMVILYMLQNAITPFTFWMASPKLVKYFHLWSRYEAEFSKEHKEATRYNRFILRMVVPLVPLGLLHIYVGLHNVLRNRLIYGLVFVPLIYSSYLIIIFWIVSHYEIRRQCRKLTKTIETEGLSKDIDHKRRCWITLSELTSATGDSQGMACGGISVSIFVAFIISCYGYFTTLLDFKEQTHVEWGLLTPVILSSLFFLIMFDNADRTSKQMGVKFSSMILNMRFSILNRDSLNQLTLLLMSMSTNPPIVKYAGFLVVDRRLFISFVSNTVSYLIVLIQFRN